MKRRKKADPPVFVWTVAGAVVGIIFVIFCFWLSFHPEVEPPPWPYYPGALGIRW